MNLFLKELLWLLFCFVVAIIITAISFSTFISKAGIEVHLHDTYLILPYWTITLTVFFPFTFLVFLFKELKHKFSKAIANLIIIASGLTMLIYLTIITRFLEKIGTAFKEEGTLYPPLSALPQSNTNLISKTNPFFDTVSNGCIVLQALIMISLLWVAYQWGTARKSINQ